MKDETPEKARSFTRMPIRTEGRLLIQSTCDQCGRSSLVSDHDGSRETWEDGHSCEQRERKVS